MSRLPVHRLYTKADELDLGKAKVYHLPDWGRLTHPERLGVIRQIATLRGRDPRIAKLAVSILKKAKIKPRQYKQQAAALLAWVQDPKNVYYVNEPGERLQDPIFTVKAGFGDCDDQVLLLSALFESVGLPWKLVLSGRCNRTGQKIRHVEGASLPSDARWAHVYGMVGTPPFSPTTWFFCEPTVQGVPLGWDVIDGDTAYLPEMESPKVGAASVVGAGPAPKGHRPKKLPAPGKRSPAYAEAYGDGRPSTAAGGAVGAAMVADDRLLDWKKIGTAVITGVAVSVLTSTLLDWVNGRGFWENREHIARRWYQHTTALGESALVRPVFDREG